MDPALRAQTEAALTGDDSAFEALIVTHGRRLFAVAYGVLQDAAEAEDVVQDAFLKAWRARHRPTDPEKFLPWLTTIARNRACDLLRRRRSTAPPDAGIPDESAPLPGDALDPAAADRQVRLALATLPEHYRIALTLRYLEGLDCRAVEAAMGLSNGALRGILGRALETLRRALKPSAQSAP